MAAGWSRYQQALLEAAAMERKPTPNTRVLRTALAAGGVLLVLGGAALAYRSSGANQGVPLLGSREDLSADRAARGDAELDSVVADGEPDSEPDGKARARRATHAAGDGAARGSASVRGGAAAAGTALGARDVAGRAGPGAALGSADTALGPELREAARTADGVAFVGGVVQGTSPGSASGQTQAASQRTGGGSVTGDTEGDADQAPSSGSGATPFTRGSPSAAVGPGGAVCGDGVLNGAEECEPNRSPTCSDDCVHLLSDQCYACAQETPCIQLANSCLEFTANEDEQSVCYDVMECVQDSGCATNPTGLTSCFCGSLTTGQCVAAPPGGDAGPDGPCADIIRQAAGGDGTPNSVVLTRYLQRNNPAGIALRYLNCLNANPTCGPVCFPR